MNRQLRPDEAEISFAAPEFTAHSGPRSRRPPSRGYLAGKRVFDIVVAVLALPLVVLAALVLLVLNPIWNRGPLFYMQKRMGRRCEPFHAIKFRTMHAAAAIDRGPDDPLETHRITRLGLFLRRTRIDELPQFLNILAGQMSLIGPRPDYWKHAIHYLETVPGYRQRYLVRPGITGLAQVDAGYAAGIEATVLKTRYDLRYLESIGYGMDWYILRRTIAVVLTGFGAQ